MLQGTFFGAHKLTCSAILLALYVVVCSAGNCVQTSTCSCSYEDGGGVTFLFNISSLGSVGSALFEDTFGDDGYGYSYSPCYPYSEDSCVDVAVCRFSKVTMAHEDVGDYNNLSFNFDRQTHDVTIIYNTTSNSSSQVKYVCDVCARDPIYKVEGQKGDERIFYFEVRSVHACLHTTTNDGPDAMESEMKQEIADMSQRLDVLQAYNIILLAAILVLVLVWAAYYLWGNYKQRSPQKVYEQL